MGEGLGEGCFRVNTIIGSRHTLAYRILRFYLGYILVTIFYLLVRFWWFHNPVESGVSYPQENLWSNFLAMLKVLASYLKLLFFPVNLNADYIVPVTFISLGYVLYPVSPPDYLYRSDWLQVVFSFQTFIFFSPVVLRCLTSCPKYCTYWQYHGRTVSLYSRDWILHYGQLLHYAHERPEVTSLSYFSLVPHFKHTFWVRMADLFAVEGLEGRIYFVVKDYCT